MGASVSSVFRGTILMRLELVSFAQARVSPATIAELVYSAQLINTWLLLQMCVHLVNSLAISVKPQEATA